MDRGCNAFVKPIALAGAVTAATVLAMASLGFAQVTAPPVPGRAIEWKSLKERLSDKGSDEQRVDNCGVPLERRGSTPRPGCPGEAESPVPARGDGRTDASTSN